eukprot:359032-Alexandrium_andersonii.AAC.1
MHASTAHCKRPRSVAVCSGGAYDTALASTSCNWDSAGLQDKLAGKALPVWRSNTCWELCSGRDKR